MKPGSVSPRFRLVLLAFFAGAATLQAQAPALLWTNNLHARLFAIDSQTNLYATTNGLVIKLTANGVPFQTNAVCPRDGMAVRDSAGNYFFAGRFDGAQDFGGITLVGGWTNWPTPGNWVPGTPTCFLAKYASNGVLQWVRSFGDQAYSSNYVHDLAVNADGSVVVGDGSALENRMRAYSASGTPNWTTSFGAAPPPNIGTVKVGPFTGTYGRYLFYRPNLILETGFFDAAGNRTSMSFDHRYFSPLAGNGKPVSFSSNDVHVAGRHDNGAFSLRQYAAGTGLVWTQAIGSVEQWVVGADANQRLFLAGTDGMFSEYNAEGVLMWSTNFGSPVFLMLADGQNNRFLYFQNGTIARLAPDLPPVQPLILTGPQPQTVMAGSNVLFSVTASGTPPLVYHWRLDNNLVATNTSGSLSLSNVTPSQGGIYTVIVSNVAGSVTSSPALLRVRRIALFLGNQLLTDGTYLFTTNPTLNIKSSFSGGSSFYTTNGSVPDFNGILYSAPFIARTGSTVRAIGYSADFTQSEEADAVQIGLLPTYTLTVVNPGGGSVVLNPAGGSYLLGTTVTATATASNGWFFQKWLQDASGTNASLNVLLDTNKTIKAVFATTLGTTAAGGGTVLMSPPGGVYGFGTTVRLTGVPDAGKYFGFWGNAATGNTNPLYFNVVNPTQTVSSIFSSTPGGQAALTVLAMGSGRVTVSPRSNSYTIGQGVTLTAVPDAGQSFLNWGGDASGSANPLPVTMNQSKLITAWFTGISTNNSVTGSDASNGFLLTLSGEAGIFKVFASSNLLSWQQIGTLTNANGQGQFLDPAGLNLPSRFYRIVPGP